MKRVGEEVRGEMSSVDRGCDVTQMTGREDRDTVTVETMTRGRIKIGDTEVKL